MVVLIHCNKVCAEQHYIGGANHRPTHPHMTTNTPTTLGRKSKQAIFDTITDAAHTLAVELNYLREADFSELPRYCAVGEMENEDEILSPRKGRWSYQPWEMVALLQLGKEYQNRYDIGWADIRWNGLNMTTNTPTTLGRKSKQAIFDTITDAAHTLAVELNYLRESDFSELPRYCAVGELENEDEILSLRWRGRLYQPWEMVALLQLGKEYQNRYDIGWADIRWNGLN